MTDRPSKPSWQLRVASVLTRWVQKPLLAFVRPWPVARALFNANAMIAYERAPGRVVRRTVVGGVPGAWIGMRGQQNRGAMLYVHGGGYVMGSVSAYRSLVARLAESAGLQAFAVEYRLAPEHPYPAAFEDVMAAYRGLLAEGYAPSEIGICGDSAGGGLVMALLHAVDEEDLPMPGAAAVMSPVVDMRLEADSLRSNARKDPLLPVRWVKAAVAAYVGEASLADPCLSPIQGDFAGCCPVLIQVGASEVLRDDAIALSGMLDTAKVDVTLKVWPHVPHVWHFFSRRVPEADAGIAEIGAFFSEKLDVAAR